MQKSTAKQLNQEPKEQVRSYPDKLFYKIGEVSRIAEVEPYVLRYWETEFPFLKPRKSKSGQRIYVKKDLEIIFNIKDLLYQERFTIEGVRKRLGDGGSAKVAASETAKAQKVSPAAEDAIKMVKTKLRAILKQLD